jgi:hypothetical protein
MAAEDGKPDHSEAQRMLDICASVGARAVDLTLTSSSGEKEWFRRNLPLAELGRMLPAMLDEAAAKKRNVIVRPHGPETALLQLDDLKAHQLPAVAFVALETSPGNYQAWLALPGKLDKDLARRIRKGAGADIGASGATRIPGSLNFKPDHAPEKTGRPHYPRVTITAAHPQLTTTTDELERLGLVAPKENFAAVAPARFEADRLRIWPDWQMAVDSAPLKKDGSGPDFSIADFRWCMLSRTWGFEEKDIVEKLLAVSEHARRPENGRPYAVRTAAKAVAWVEQRRQWKRQRHG